MNYSLQIEQAKDFLSIEYVSTVGLLLFAVVGLVFYLKKQQDRHDKIVSDLQEDIKAKDEVIYNFLEKFTEITTEVKGFLRK